MTVRRAAAALLAWVIAITIAFALPVAQVQTVAPVPACCCPDPALCHCPDHTPVHGDQSHVRACHRGVAHAAPAPVTAVVAPIALAVTLVRTPAAAPLVALAAPHAPPAPARPAAPS